MKINADFDKRVVVHSTQMEWVGSPIQGVDRRPLDRVGEEVARATTIVRYAPGSEFAPHVHTGGEEFVVLEGVFQDEHGDFPTGSYIRNPPQSSHKPGSAQGCVIFVKLWQFELDDRTHVRLRTDHMGAVPLEQQPGVDVTPLYFDSIEEVMLVTLAPNAIYTLPAPDGAELLVLDGTLQLDAELLERQSWLREPIGGHVSVKAGESGAKVWVKTGNLTHVDAQIERVNNR